LFYRGDVELREPEELNVGGQAVIGGVMMRSPQKVATAVRRLSGEITVSAEPFASFSDKHKFLRLPLVRGVVSLVETLFLGIKTLNFSAEIAARDLDSAEQLKNGERKTPSGSFGVAVVLTAILAFGLALVLFFFFPILLAELSGLSRASLFFNLVAGFIRAAIFLGYIYAISLFKEMRKIFEYHGAEHKSIFVLEAGEELTVEAARGKSTKHPRCGNSFLLIVAILAIITYSVSDTVFALLFGHPPALLVRFGLHLSLLPLVGGSSYELLKLSSKTRNRRLSKILIAPGLWLQEITTREPDDGQLEVALCALKEAIGTGGLEEEPSKLTVDRTPDAVG
jgi:uncharacterized protein YqhQ